MNQILPFTEITRSPSALVALAWHRGESEDEHLAKGFTARSVGSGRGVCFDFAAAISPSEELNSLLFQIVPFEVIVTSSGAPPVWAILWTFGNADVIGVVVHPAATVRVMLACPAPPEALEHRCVLEEQAISSKA